MPSPRLLLDADVPEESNLADRRAKRLQGDEGVVAQAPGDVGPFGGLHAAGDGAGDTVIAPRRLELRAELGDAGDQHAPAFVDEARAADGAQLELGAAEEMHADDDAGRFVR